MDHLIPGHLYLLKEIPPKELWYGINDIYWEAMCKEPFECLTFIFCVDNTPSFDATFTSKSLFRIHSIPLNLAYPVVILHYLEDYTANLQANLDFVKSL